MEMLKKTAALRVQKQTENMNPSEVLGIALNGVPAMPELLSPYFALTRLSLICMKPKIATLLTLSLEKFQQLRLLDVSDNAITVPESLPVCPSAVQLVLANNCITTMEEVRRLSDAFPNVSAVDLIDNPVSTPQNFSSLFSTFAKLEALNYQDKDGVDVEVHDPCESSSGSESEYDSSEEDDGDESGSEDDDEEEESSEDNDDDDDEPASKRARA